MAEEITNVNNTRIRGSNVLRTNSWSNGNESGEDSELLNDNENDENVQSTRYVKLKFYSPSSRFKDIDSIRIIDNQTAFSLNKENLDSKKYSKEEKAK